MKHRIIGISGPAGSGKDTAAKLIKSLLPAMDYQLTSFADPLKIMLSKGLGITARQLYGDEKEVIDPRYGCTARHMMQTLGTEWGRNTIDQDIWVKSLENRINTLGGNWIIPDVRFESEANFIRENGILLNIIGRKTLDHNHKSESGIYMQDGDVIIPNSRELEHFLLSTEYVVLEFLS